MRSERFSAVVLSGHKGLGFAVPFDPGSLWSVSPVSLRPGRRGYRVRGTFNGKPFESAVSRARRFFVLVTAEMEESARLREGSAVRVSIRSGD